MIIESINALTKKLTGQDGTGSDITESINDLTKKWTGSDDRGETIAEALDVLAQHAEGGGGGGGDFTTATVVITNSGTGLGVLSGTISCIDAEYDQLITLPIAVESGTSETYSVPAYKTGTYFELSIKDGTTPTLTGDVVYEDGGFVITGDCTITAEGD